jgi:hypothetical protein
MFRECVETSLADAIGDIKRIVKQQSESKTSVRHQQESVEQNGCTLLKSTNTQKTVNKPPRRKRTGYCR